MKRLNISISGVPEGEDSNDCSRLEYMQTPTSLVFFVLAFLADSILGYCGLF